MVGFRSHVDVEVDKASSPGAIASLGTDFPFYLASAPT